MKDVYGNEYDGWVIKSMIYKDHFLMLSTFRCTRTECISAYGLSWYIVEKNRGHVIAVKVNLTEVGV